jgi:hypothetical protein
MGGLKMNTSTHGKLGFIDMADTFVLCDKCAEEFKLKQGMVEERTLKMRDGNVLKVLYFCCPSCGKPYIIQCLDEETKSIQKEYQELIGKINDKKYSAIRQLLFTRKVSKGRRLEGKIKNLKSKYGKEIESMLLNLRNN